MKIATVGLITYDVAHLKTEQVLQKLLHRPFEYRMYALKFQARKPREVVFHHRPNQSEAVHGKALAERHGIPYKVCESDLDIASGCDVYLVLGAGLLSPECIADKKILNCHAGIIPSSRGLDAFKWAIYHGKPLGVSLHYIDANVDDGDLVAVVPTPVYRGDSLETLARRHYENELDVMGRFDHFLAKPSNPCADLTKDEPTMRMPRGKERQLAEKVEGYVARYANRVKKEG